MREHSATHSIIDTSRKATNVSTKGSRLVQESAMAAYLIRVVRKLVTYISISFSLIHWIRSKRYRSRRHVLFADFGRISRTKSKKSRSDDSSDVMREDSASHSIFDSPQKATKSSTKWSPPFEESAIEAYIFRVVRKHVAYILIDNVISAKVI